MTRLGQRSRPHRTVRSCGLLVAALLLGLLGMHGLGPVPAIHDPAEHDRTVAAAHTGVALSTPDECEHGEGGCSGHLAHADPACASASVSGTPDVVPVLQPDVVSRAGPAPDVRTSPGGSGPDGGRAPPSLSELQLLRI
ncbi:DUF6153 family protein [Streptomyces sp. ALI-76-A]|uniref:DUF6153 family protein n=1 Tax=Streptomyces sp. ALI-76-A TaxID=3025736 RepID=UPI00256ED271|nr:DUF6153 family protein [Streptomyces sp. ALI-76-A]MDL5199269.1 DUF6153 family protein [Streptomyces sp. ALI-76-A]